MDHFVLFALVMVAFFGTICMVEFLRIRRGWMCSGDITVTFVGAVSLVIVVWATTLLVKVLPGIPAC